MPDTYCDECSKRCWVLRVNDHNYCATCKDKARKEGRLLI